MDKSKTTAIVIPTYNERDNVQALTGAVLDVLPHARVLIVDDNSPDGTGKLADELATVDNRVSVLHRREKAGLGAAYVAGFQYVLTHWPDTEFVIQMDADFSHAPSYLPSFLEAMDSADLAVGSRYVNGISIVNWPIHRLLISWCGTKYARMVTGLPITDCTSGFKCWRAEVLRAIGLEGVRSNGYVFQVETSFRAWRQGYRLVDVPIIFYERTKGQSKLNLTIALEASWVVLKLGLIRLSKKRMHRFALQKAPRSGKHD